MKATEKEKQEFYSLVRTVWRNPRFSGQPVMFPFHEAVKLWRTNHTCLPFETVEEFRAYGGNYGQRSVTPTQQEQRQYLNQRDKIRVQRNIHPRR